MAVKPQVMENSLNATSVDILNFIRAGASANYKDYVPKAENTAESVKEIGGVIMQYQALRNEFLSALVNRIGRVMITSKMYTNPLAVFKKGEMEFGETMEEIFVNIANVHSYNPEVAEEKVFEREIPDVRAAFYILNYQKFYKATIQNNSLKQAFLSWNGVSDLIARIVDSMYTGAAYDEYITAKYALARNILDGRFYPVEVPTVNKANMSDVAAGIKGISNELEFMSPQYNIAGVTTHTPKGDQYLISTAQFDANMDVDVLSSAFNMSKAEFMGHRMVIDSFGKADTKRLSQLYAGDPNYRPFTDAEIEALNTIPAILIDWNFLVMFDNLAEFTENFNGEGMYWNYWYHVWKTFGVSPFANAIVFVQGTPTVTSVTLTPATATVSKGQAVQLTATVEGTNFVSKAVDYTFEPAAQGISIDPAGVVTISPDTDATSITVTAASVADPTKTATAKITIS